jgi:acetate kinase
MQILVLNSGSSSIKFSIFAVAAHTSSANPQSLVDGQLSGIGGAESKLTVHSANGSPQKLAESTIDTKSLAQAITTVLDTISATGMPDFQAVGYRVVHPGPKLHNHQKITTEVLDDLEAASKFAPLHDPEALQMIRTVMSRFPNLPHYACFDTVFHQTMPEEATTYPLPQEYRDRGVRRYGFHGLSCESIVRQLQAHTAVPKRMAIAHLGSGCSVTALVDGRSVDTTMGLTPTGGIVMGTRPGDLDPGLVLYLLRQQKQQSEEGVAAVETLLNHASGMVAVSGMANDVKAMRKASDEGNEHAALALKIFTRSVTKAIGSFCWLLGGLDAIVLAGGIGEHDAQTRSEILDGLAGLGIDIDRSRNQAGVTGIQQISSLASRTQVFVVPAQEDLMIAVHVERMERQEAREASHVN